MPVLLFFMFPYCWITALLALLASLGVSFFKPSKEIIVLEAILVIVIFSFFILRKLRNKKNKCCSKINKSD